MASANYDDLLATAHEHAKSSEYHPRHLTARGLIGVDFAYDWLIELSHLLKLHVDYSEEQHFDVLIRNTTIQLCLSIQNSLGFKGDFQPRVFIGKFSWLVLQLRNIVVLVTMAANMNVTGPNNQKASPLEDPGSSPDYLVRSLADRLQR
jgi:mediator of RNA polymerase II transcription subunit 16